MLLMIIAGAAIYGYMLTKLRVPQELVALVTERRRVGGHLDLPLSAR